MTSPLISLCGFSRWPRRRANHDWVRSDERRPFFAGWHWRKDLVEHRVGYASERGWAPFRRVVLVDNASAHAFGEIGTRRHPASDGVFLGHLIGEARHALPFPQLAEGDFQGL